MTRILSLIAGVLCLVFTAAGQSFIDLNFEQANTDSESTFVNWANAATNWQHANVQLQFVYHISPPMDSGGYYFLVDSLCSQFTPFDGNFSFVLSSGYLSASHPELGFVHASISQTGLIPNNALSFRMLASGNFSVLLDSTVITMYNLGGNMYAGDISAFAGSTRSLQIVNNSNTSQNPVQVDDLQFSPTAAPEPSSLAIMSAGAVALIVAIKRRR